MPSCAVRLKFPEEPLRQPVRVVCPLLVGEAAFWSAGIVDCGAVGFCCVAGEFDVCGADCCAEFWSVVVGVVADCCCATAIPPVSSNAAVKLSIFRIVPPNAAPLGAQVALLVRDWYTAPRCLIRLTNREWLLGGNAGRTRPATMGLVMADELWMEEALREAQRARALGEVPVGAVVVCDGQVVARGCNRNLADHDPTAHAEIVALRAAARALGNHRLGECSLFVTIEPCPMCAGAIVLARLRELVYGADDPKAGAVHSVTQVINHPALNHLMEVRGGVLAGRCAEILQTFFRERR